MSDLFYLWLRCSMKDFAVNINIAVGRRRIPDVAGIRHDKTGPNAIELGIARAACGQQEHSNQKHPNIASGRNHDETFCTGSAGQLRRDPCRTRRFD
jgi:hypothetical protein